MDYYEEDNGKKSVRGWNIDLADKHGCIINMDCKQYLMVDRPEGINDASMWITNEYKRWYSIFFHNGRLEEMNGKVADSYYFVIQSIVDHLGHSAHGDYFKSTAGNAGSAMLDFANLIEITRDFCKRHKRPYPKIKVSKGKKVVCYNEHGVFVGWDR